MALTGSKHDAALVVAETLVRRRDVEAEVISAKANEVAENSPYWFDLMVRERDARVANDEAVAIYRKLRGVVASSPSHT